MRHHYEIASKGKHSYLYRIEGDGAPIKLAVADDHESRFRLARMKDLFDEIPIPLDELHAAEVLGANSVKATKPSWTSVGLVGGSMEVWEISDVQARALRRVKDTKKEGLHQSVLNCRTVSALLRYDLVRERRACKAYLVLTDAGKKLLKRVER